jgi:hypothetical protein
VPFFEQTQSLFPGSSASWSGLPSISISQHFQDQGTLSISQDDEAYCCFPRGPRRRRRC